MSPPSLASGNPIEDAARAALAGDPIVFPTDTVYGLGTRPDDPAATARLFEAKSRPRDLELPVLVPTAASARDLAVFDDRAETLAARFWAGPLTLVLPRTDASRGFALGGDPGTIGLRIPRHPLALAILARTGPLAVTSANRTGEPTPTTCAEIAEVFGERVAVILCAEENAAGAPSTVVDLTAVEPRVRRVGAVSEREVLEALAAPGVARGPV